MFGTATYFAPNASKSDIYTDFAARTPRWAERKLVIARLALGLRPWLSPSWKSFGFELVLLVMAICRCPKQGETGLKSLRISGHGGLANEPTLLKCPEAEPPRGCAMPRSYASP